MSGARVVLVTGGVRGLGLAAAQRLAREGWSCHLTWRSSRGLAAERAAEFGADHVHRCDLAEPGAARRCVEAVLAIEGRLDALVHAVGDYDPGSLEEMEVRRIEALFASNVTSALHAIGAARAALRASRGALLLFGTAGLEGLRARRRSAAYAATKSALLVLARSLALEEAPHGVRVNVVSPGHAPHAHAHADSSAPELAERIPAGRVGSPVEIAAAVAWLLSDEARYVTGADLPVAGGYML